MLVDPELIDQEWRDYIFKLIRYRLRFESDERLEEVYKRVMKRLKRMRRRQVDLKLKFGDRSMKALLARLVRLSVIDWLLYINGKKMRLEAVKQSSKSVERLGAADVGIEFLIWPGPGKTTWSIRGIPIREIFGKDLEKIPNCALLRARLWGWSYEQILAAFPGLTWDKLRGRLYRAKKRAKILWKRAVMLQELRWAMSRREDRRKTKVGGFRGRRFH